MRLCTVLGLAATTLHAVSAAPAPSPQLVPPQLAPAYHLRVHAPEQPWHHRHIIQLPSTRLLGLENFTRRPETTPVTVLPIQIPDKAEYALRVPDRGDDLSRTPYVSALLPKDTARGSVSLRIIYIPDPRDETIGRNPDACPGGKKCAASAFVLYGMDSPNPEDGVVEEKLLGKLAYSGFEGHWEAVKDAPRSEGWHLYWKPTEGAGDVELGTKIEIDVVSVE
ncbi:hypothetical protein M011DRAFT_88526 [Sporormia fimetaria CBS 119925]|uniref:Ubiquitin 3 binding protein But2 C-terminal domain-containing protein n=1 Tax=Sporormia fimetaria CBS 119925 TaxID=1340428 RepID=A0A6A6V697_9PLEO|nr:hypothetical protein M011DRAFT_88526 [Sporormia fimetaria CBS 119925]